jgi:DNA repair exonuclease SbcCD ATPase subunit
MNKITSSSRIKIYWDDVPENYSRELEKRIQAQYATLCGVHKNQVKVVYRAKRIDGSGNVVEFSDSGVDNIMDVNYQQELQKKWLDLNDVKVDFERIVKLDNRVNNSLGPQSVESLNRRWSIEEIKINNFLCFGKGNVVDFDKLAGISVINSLPENQGGKTTFSIDAPKFLLYGKTTKTDKNEEIFNSFSDENELLVEGIIKIESDRFVIQRKMSRTPKRSGDGYTIKNSVKYYRILPDGRHDELDGEDAKETTNVIINAIGNEADFDTTTLATMDNLEDLITTKPAENGKLLNRFIGLEIVDTKLKAAREMYNEFSKKKIGNQYNVVTLREEIEELKLKIETLTGLQKSHTDNMSVAQQQLTELNNEKDSLLSQKFSVDEELLNLNTSTINTEIEAIIAEGKRLGLEKDRLEAEIKVIEKVDFDESLDFQLSKQHNDSIYAKSNLEKDIQRHLKTISELESAQICPTCKRDLDDVDNAGEIAKLKSEITENKASISEYETLIEELKGRLAELAKAKAQVDKKNKLEVELSVVNVDVVTLRGEYKEKTAKLKNYEKNKEVIDKNKALDSKIENVKTQIKVQENKITEYRDKIGDIKVEITTSEKDIETKERNIEKIIAEEEVERIFKVYLEMYGKKGIGKMVLRTILPIINSELIRLMDDVCDFYVRLDVNAKNDVEYQIVKDDVVKSLKSGSGLEKTISSIAIRAILGKMAYLPLPNFITFDEVFGKVADENLEKMRSIFDKIKELYDMVFIITHNKLVKDWADKIITIKKTDNISEIKIK